MKVGDLHSGAVKLEQAMRRAQPALGAGQRALARSSQQKY